MNAELKQGMYPAKPRTSMEAWAEWICDECGIERGELVERDRLFITRLAYELRQADKAVIAFAETCSIGPEGVPRLVAAVGEYLNDAVEMYLACAKDPPPPRVAIR